MKKLLPVLLLVVFVLSGCSVKSADDYYNSSESGEYTATISVNCQTAVDYEGSDRDNAEILTDYTVSFDEGDSVFDALKNACKENKIQFEYDGSGTSAYVTGIDYLYGGDCGDLSGWQYRVNGEFGNVGCAEYELNDGDIVEWLYTCDFGADIGNAYDFE
ncbi:MAG: DUF4430 domain-containing protein [Ruminococcus sp.]|nr:DUF4430 domain-containing protein [Ruminococcus sp.]